MVLSDNTLFVYNLYSNYRELEIRLKSVKNYREIQGEFVDFDVCESWRGIVAVRLLTVGGCVAELLYLFRGVMVVER